MPRGPAWYETPFEAAKPQHITGGKTTDYLWTTSDGAEHHIADAHQRIHALYSTAKLIVTLRNPVERAVSALNHLIRTGRISPMQEADELLSGTPHPHVKQHGVLQKGLYFDQIQAYLKQFDSKQFLFLIFEEDIIDRPVRTLEHIRTLLEVPTNFSRDGISLDRKVNAHRFSTFGLFLRHYTPLPRTVVKGLDFPFSSRKITPNHKVILELYDLYTAPNRKLFGYLRRQPRSWFKSTYLQDDE